MQSIIERDGIVVWLGDRIEAEFDALDANAPWYEGPTRRPFPARRVPAKLRDAVIERDGGACRECGIRVRRDKRDKYDSGRDLAEVDHIVPVADGGSNDKSNLRLLCLGCNRRKAGADARRRNQQRAARGGG